MITSIEFKNFKVLRQAKLPMGRCTVIVGPNGSGKSTVMQALDLLAGRTRFNRSEMASFGTLAADLVEILVCFDKPDRSTKVTWSYDATGKPLGPSTDSGENIGSIKAFLSDSRVYRLDPSKIALPASVQQNPIIPPDGQGLAAVLDHLMNEEPEQFGHFSEALAFWFPEYERLGVEAAAPGSKAFYLQDRTSGHRVPASALSDGTLLAIALLTIAYAPGCPRIIGLEEPDHGLHPRMLRMIQDVIYRLSHPDGAGEKREPVQVIVTTHSPYFLDLFKEHPEEVVIANKTADGAKFERLSEQPYLTEVLDGASLGDIWYSGILGGVPSER